MSDNVKKEDREAWANQLSPLTLAYMGDAAYEYFVRSELIRLHPNETPHDLHIRATQIVRASAQAATVVAVFEDLTEQERSLYRRGRNAKSASVPKNADVAHYRMATGFETLIGFLQLSGADQRLQELLQMVQRRTWKEFEHEQG